MNFRERAARLGGEISRDLPFFTVHDVTHLDALWEMVDLVAGPDYPLTPAEAFVLGGAILVHDLAMSQAAFQDEFAKLKSEPMWPDTVAGLLRPKLDRSPTGEEIANPDPETEQLAIRTLLRDLHARQAAVLLTKEWGYAGTTYFLLDDADLRAAFADDIGKVAFSHHWPLESLLDASRLPQSRAGGPGWLPHEWTIDLVKLACLLRTADAAHVDDRRAPGFLAALRQPVGVSDNHWRFQSLLRTPYREPHGDRIRYRSSRPFKVDEFEAWWVAYEWLRMVDGELRAVDALLADTSRPRMAAKGVLSVDHPTRLVEDIRTDGWEPADAEIRISDIAGLVQMLGGTQLYGRRLEVPLRELIQNGADAIRARRKLQNRDTSFGRIIVRPGRDIPANQDWIEVEDNGVGMSKSVLTGPLLDFGAAFWGTHKMRREFPGLEAAGLEATGQFGIGFFSVFMWGDRVQVTTRRYDRGYGETWVLEFRRGIGLRPLLRRGTPEEQQSLPEGGTRVRVWCEPSRQVATTLRRREGRSDSYCTWAELCEWLAPALDVNVDVDVSGSVQRSVQADDWLTIDAGSLLGRFNRKGEPSAIAHIEAIAEAWRGMTVPLRVVRDALGRPIARGTVWMPELGPFRGSCTVIGGFRTDGGANFMGLRFAHPETAARHGAIPLEHRSGWIAWAEEQQRFDNPTVFPDEIRALAATRLAPLIDPGSMPIGQSHRGWVSLAQFVAEIAAVNAFRCITGPLGYAPVLLQESRDMPTIVVNGHYLLNQVDGGCFAVVRMLKDLAAQQWGHACQLSDLNRGMAHRTINGQLVAVHTILFSRAP